MKIKLQIAIVLILISINSIAVAQNKILFDATKAEMAGNADWIIDADAHNIYFNSTTHLPYASTGTTGASNPQRYPTPAQSGITATTTEGYWQGALSYWAVDCAKKGYVVESLPYNAAITYGVSSNPQDLSNYKAFMVTEPNMLFSASEKTAIINFVAAGGGLFMIADHDVSDRNNDGYDSPHIWNDLLGNNSVVQDPFGIAFDYVDISGTYTNVANLPTDPILHGSNGNVTKVQWSGGTTMTLNTTSNSSVKGVAYKTGASTTGFTNVLCAYANYGNGKVAAVGDSSIVDDGTGDTGDTLYDGYITDAAGNHQKLIMNITDWLMTPNLSTTENLFNESSFVIAPNPIDDFKIHLSFSINEVQEISVTVFDVFGRQIKTVVLNDLKIGLNQQSIDVNDLQSGLYICKIANGSGSKSLKFNIK
ncbi:T9SS type A sorting domain-containing protein [Flavobacterium sp. SUN052]|uniref:T9SS type A sorting domain-containing protein n=1 Tax=Flavobacterium sp. SUN052 TaxID=3002441 RepID=UPI00237D34C7|nr:T9SS type A sorting domain-containing protein [Flavobacterium sp. SUN052]MEC4005000.1 T9SS type A sorting domain-containing protein [Flavobacterium sp. SUN052]